MGARRDARQFAVQFLYQQDLQGEFARAELPAGELAPEPAADTLTPLLEAFWQMSKPDKAARAFAEELICGALKHVEEVDQKIVELTDNWNLDRIAAVDRNILRLAVFEMLFRDDIPPVVSINEAIEVAKRYSTEESGRFVNGILDRLKKEVLRPSRHSAGG